MILDKQTAEKKLRRMAFQIAERNHDKPSLVLIGIKENGIVIAKKMADYLKEIFKGNIETISLSINKKAPGAISLDKETSLENKTILIIDDVANSGRTMLYAISPLLEQGPSSIQTLVLVERTHKLFPVATDYVGLSVSTEPSQHIIVVVKDSDIVGAYLN
jgi:pyrimidine operon attenuation protein / uracil phosphoribosyltransferase